MKYSNTTLKELTNRYKHVLLKCAFLNAAIITGVIVATPVMADTTITTGVSNNAVSDTAGQQAGGLTIGYTDSVKIADNVTYDSNSSVNSGGGIKALNGFTAGNGLQVTNNHSDKIGGGLYVRVSDDSNFNQNPSATPSNRTVSIGNNAVFSGNSSSFLGGGLAVETVDTMTIGSGALFEGNSSATDGGGVAVWTDGSNNLNGTPINTGSVVNFGQTEFKNNTAANRGGAIANLNNDTASTSYGNTINIGSGSKFTGNTVTSTDDNKGFGGAIFNDATGTINVGANTIFDSNTASYQGGAIYNLGTMTVGSNSVFNNNSAKAIGALFNNGSMTIGDNVQFTKNQATASNGTAGAVYNQNGIMTFGTGTIFSENTSARSAGAFYQEEQGQTTTSGASSTFGAGTQFLKNTAANNGGALGNFNDSTEDKNSIINLGANTLFDGNIATNAGGAIVNYDGEINIADGAVFSNNTAGTTGGAISNINQTNNSAVINFNGNTTFAGNIANGVKNDIYNTGTLNINAGTLTLDGGIAGDGIVKFASGSSLKMDLNSTTSSSAIIAGKEVSGSTSLVIENGSTGGEFLISGTNVNTLSFGQNALYSITPDTDTTSGDKIFTVMKKDLSEATEALTSQGANATQATTIAAMTDATPTTAAAQAIANAMTTAAQTGDIGAATALANAVNPVTTPVVQTQAVGTTTQVMNVATNRMSGNSEGRSGGSMGDFAYGPWIQGLYNKTHNSQGAGFNGYSQGFALGMDVDVTDATMLGAAYAYTATDIKSNGRTTNVYGDNYMIYGKYQPNEWYTSGSLNYGHGNYRENSLGLHSKYNVDTYGAQALVGYEKGIFNNYAGVRYVYVNPDSYSNGLTEVDTKNSQVGTAIIGTTISKEYKHNGVVWKPEFRLAGTYDVKSDDSSSNVSIIGSNTTYTVAGERLHRAALQTGVGVKASVKNLDVILGYDAEFRVEQTSQTGTVKLQYNF